MDMERRRSFSHTFTDRPSPLRIATVKPVSKSFSEDDLLKATEPEAINQSPTRVFSRFNVQDLSLLKKDNIIGELEKCLQELESEHGYAQRLGDVYEKVECERNQLLDELDIAFQDLHQYMQRQKQIEDEKSNIENDRKELVKENEYLKVVLSNRNEIKNNKLQEDNLNYVARIEELETKNTQHLEEINELYAERQTLISSLLNLQSKEVEDVLHKTSCSNSPQSIVDFDVFSSGQNIVDISKDTLTDIDPSTKVQNASMLKQHHMDGINWPLVEEFDSYSVGTVVKINEFSSLKSVNSDIIQHNDNSLPNAIVEEDGTGNRYINWKSVNSSTLSEKIIELETHYCELESSNKQLFGNKKEYEKIVTDLKQKYENVLKEKNIFFEISEGFKIELDDFRQESDNKYSDLTAEYNDVCNHNQELQNKIEIICAEKENVMVELDNNRNEVIEKIKQDFYALEKENLSLAFQKESLEKTVKVKLETELELKEICSNLRKQVDEGNPLKFNPCPDSEETSILQRKYEVLQKDYERLLSRCRQLETTVTDSTDMIKELKRFKDGNEMLLNRYRSLEADYDIILKSRESEKKLHSTLLVEFENKCQQYDIGCKQYDSLENVHNELRNNYEQIVQENQGLFLKYEDLQLQHKLSCSNYNVVIKERNELFDKIKKCHCIKRKKQDDSNEKCSEEEIAVSVELTPLQNQIVIKNLQNEIFTLKDEHSDLMKKKQELQKQISFFNQEINHLAENRRQIDSLENETLEKDFYQIKYDRLSIEFEKLTKEKAHFALTVETLRDENKRLNQAVCRQRLVSSSSQDILIKKLKNENESFQEKFEIISSNASNAINENKRLLDRIRRSDEMVATTIRNLKARKNELQLQVETLKHENDYLKKMPRMKEKIYKFGKNSSEKKSELALVNEGIRNAHVKIAELQLENDDLRLKLQEYEVLLNEQHQALAHANDLAMQKNLECSKMKRTLEKRIDKIIKENNELRRIIFLLDDSNTNRLSTRNSLSSTEKQISSETSIVNITFSTDDPSHSLFEADKSPKIISLATVSNPLSEQSFSSISTVPESPRLATSRQLENDLSLQLKKLLDLSDKNTLLDDDQGSEVSEESIAPPVPPPPPNYGSSIRRHNFRVPFFRAKQK